MRPEGYAFDYIGCQEGHKYPYLQIGDEEKPTHVFLCHLKIDKPLPLLKNKVVFGTLSHR